MVKPIKLENLHINNSHIILNKKKITSTTTCYTHCVPKNKIKMMDLQKCFDKCSVMSLTQILYFFGSIQIYRRRKIDDVGGFVKHTYISY